MLEPQVAEQQQCSPAFLYACIIKNYIIMCYYLIADLDVGKYEIYHISNKDLFYYDDFVKFLREKTGHDIRSSVQDEPIEKHCYTICQRKGFCLFWNLSAKIQHKKYEIIQSQKE